MMKKNSNSKNQTPLDNDLLNRFDDKTKSRIIDIWNKSDRADEERKSAFKNRVKPVDQALQEIEEQLDTSKYSSDYKQSNSGWSKKWILAAAMLLIVLGAGYLLIPKVYLVPYGEIVQIELPDGTHVELNSGTQIHHSRLFGITNRTLHMNGEAFFTVRDDQLPFIIHANESIVEVTGTRFNVRSWSSDPNSETLVTVADGEVHFYPVQSPDRRVILSQGLISSWNSTMTTPLDPEKVTVDRVLSWRENLLNFEEKPLAVILSELERRFDVQIDLEVPEMSSETLTTFYTEQRELEIVLKDLCLVKGLRYAETANGYRIYQ
jgi:transmembrane sensor